ncbi:Hypothetical_protein [Hexamita inflata]|uniref:Hypothetical_protein n=1 Tax=Hexamita inflata TaxID=28002 RepID=A0AA86P9H4_9EUKA|nr:Hypothetical protein HINF_LOCUS19483 [Hexamita inflata]CAI9933411.1 Hypothetical protein HINF_LOCUS21056 [Hexamita inflata]
MQLLSQVPMLPKLQSKIKTQQSYIRRTSNLTQDFGAVNSKSQLSQQIWVSMGQLRELDKKVERVELQVNLNEQATQVIYRNFTKIRNFAVKHLGGIQIQSSLNVI